MTAGSSMSGFQSSSPVSKSSANRKQSPVNLPLLTKDPTLQAEMLEFSCVTKTTLHISGSDEWPCRLLPSAVHPKTGRGRVEGHADVHVVQSQLDEERAQNRNSYAQLAQLAHCSENRRSALGWRAAFPRGTSPAGRHRCRDLDAFQENDEMVEEHPHGRRVLQLLLLISRLLLLFPEKRDKLVAAVFLLRTSLISSIYGSSAGFPRRQQVA